MNRLERLCGNLRNLVCGRHLYSIFIPALLWGDVFDAEAAENRRVYRPTQAQLRLEQQNRQREAQIQEIRRRQALAQKNKAQKVRQTKPQTVQTVRSQPAQPQVQSTRKPVKIRYIWYQSRRFVLVQDIARYYGMKISYYKSGLTLRSSRDVVTLLYDKRMANINRTNMYLTHAPVLRGALVYLDEKDFLLVVDPVIRNTPLWKHSLRTVLIDAGHGGKDQGAPGGKNLLEKNITLSIARKLAARLQKQGYRVLMTRNNDRYLTLQQRADLCEKLKPDLFISIHCNAVGNRKIKGIETFAMTPVDAASTSDSKRGTTTGAGNSFDKNNYRLAYEVQKNLTTTLKAEDRGVKHARFFVLRHATCPAILIETGFITHPTEGVNLARSAYQDRLVNGIVSGISAYAKSAAPPKKQTAAVRKK